jgi:anti-sigma-K factor RskA
MTEEEIQEEAALYVLNLLPPEERQRFEEKLAEDPRFQKAVGEMGDSLSLLARALPQHAPRPELREKILRSVCPEGPEERPTRRGLFPAWVFGKLPWALAASFALALAVLLWDRSRLLTELEALRREDRLAEIRIAELQSRLSEAQGKVCLVLWDRQKQEGIFWVSQPLELPQDRDFQLWVLDAEAPQPVSAGVIRVEPKGRGYWMRFRPQGPITRPKGFAVSLEPKGGSPAPTGPILWSGE